MDVKRKRLLLVAVIVALFIAGCGAQKSGSDTAGASLSVASVRGIDNEGRGLEIGQLAPDFEMQYPDGRKVKLSDFKGKPVIVNFWATWCAPCEAELPEFVQTYEKYKDQGVAILDCAARFADVRPFSSWLQSPRSIGPVAASAMARKRMPTQAIPRVRVTCSFHL